MENPGICCSAQLFLSTRHQCQVQQSPYLSQSRCLLDWASHKKAMGSGSGTGRTLPGKEIACNQKDFHYFSTRFASRRGAPPPLHGPIAGVAQLVEHFLAKEDVASSSLVTRSGGGCMEGLGSQTPNPGKPTPAFANFADHAGPEFRRKITCRTGDQRENHRRKPPARTPTAIPSRERPNTS